MRALSRARAATADPMSWQHKRMKLFVVLGSSKCAIMLSVQPLSHTALMEGPTSCNQFEVKGKRKRGTSVPVANHTNS